MTCYCDLAPFWCHCFEGYFASYLSWLLYSYARCSYIAPHLEDFVPYRSKVRFSHWLSLLGRLLPLPVFSIGLHGQNPCPSTRGVKALQANLGFASLLVHSLFGAMLLLTHRALFGAHRPCWQCSPCYSSLLLLWVDQVQPSFHLPLDLRIHRNHLSLSLVSVRCKLLGPETELPPCATEAFMLAHYPGPIAKAHLRQAKDGWGYILIPLTIRQSLLRSRFRLGMVYKTF